MNWANHQTKKATSDHTQRLRAFLLAILFAVSSPLSMAQANSAPDSEQAGHIIMVTGQVIARDSSGSARQLSRSSSIFVGDTILTGPAASTQIRMVDQAQISLKADTQFTIGAYQYDENIVTDVVSLSLIQGGFRTITGVIWDQNKEAYEATISNFATIGIRGTDYEVVITPAGEIFTGVYDGGTTIANAAGELDLGLGVLFDFATVPDPQTPPQGLTAQPAELGIIPIAVLDQDTDEEDTGSEDDGGDADGDDGDGGDGGDDENGVDDGDAGNDDNVDGNDTNADGADTDGANPDDADADVADAAGANPNAANTDGNDGSGNLAIVDNAGSDNANATAPVSNADSSQDTTDTTTEITIATGATTSSNTVSVTGF